MRYRVLQRLGLPKDDASLRRSWGMLSPTEQARITELAEQLEGRLHVVGTHDENRGSNMTTTANFASFDPNATWSDLDGPDRIKVLRTAIMNWAGRDLQSRELAVGDWGGLERELTPEELSKVVSALKPYASAGAFKAAGVDDAYRECGAMWDRLSAEDRLEILQEAGVGTAAVVWARNNWSDVDMRIRSKVFAHYQKSGASDFQAAQPQRPMPTATCATGDGNSTMFVGPPCDPSTMRFILRFTDNRGGKMHAGVKEFNSRERAVKAAALAAAMDPSTTLNEYSTTNPAVERPVNFQAAGDGADAPWGSGGRGPLPTCNACGKRTDDAFPIKEAGLTAQQITGAGLRPNDFICPKCVMDIEDGKLQAANYIDPCKVGSIIPPHDVRMKSAKFMVGSDMRDTIQAAINVAPADHPTKRYLERALSEFARGYKTGCDAMLEMAKNSFDSKVDEATRDAVFLAIRLAARTGMQAQAKFARGDAAPWWDDLPLDKRRDVLAKIGVNAFRIEDMDYDRLPPNVQKKLDDNSGSFQAASGDLRKNEVRLPCPRCKMDAPMLTYNDGNGKQVAICQLCEHEFHPGDQMQANVGAAATLPNGTKPLREAPKLQAAYDPEKQWKPKAARVVKTQDGIFRVIRDTHRGSASIVGEYDNEEEAKHVCDTVNRSSGHLS